MPMVQHVKTRTIREITFLTGGGPKKLVKIYPRYFVTPLSNAFVDLRARLFGGGVCVWAARGGGP